MEAKSHDNLQHHHLPSLLHNILQVASLLHVSHLQLCNPFASIKALLVKLMCIIRSPKVEHQIRVWQQIANLG